MTRPSLTLAPVLRATVTVVIAVTVFLGILAVERVGSGGEPMGRAFAVWATGATVGLMAWAFVFVDGVGRLRRLPSMWKPGIRWLIGAIALYVVLAAAATTLLLVLTVEMGRSVGSPGVLVIVRALTVLGWVAGAPWLLLVWITHERVRALREQLRATPDHGFGILKGVNELDAIWQALERSSLALGLMLSTLVINTALMRNAAIEAGIPEGDFSGWQVIGYGIFFMIILAAILVPVLVGWRDAGFELVRRAVPDDPTGIPDKESADARERLVVRIGVDRSYVRRPIAILGVLSPFLTSFATALISAVA